MMNRVLATAFASAGLGWRPPGRQERFFADTLAEYQWARDMAGLAPSTLERLTRPVIEVCERFRRGGRSCAAGHQYPGAVIPGRGMPGSACQIRPPSFPRAWYQKEAASRWIPFPRCGVPRSRPRTCRVGREACDSPAGPSGPRLTASEAAARHAVAMRSATAARKPQAQASSVRHPEGSAIAGLRAGACRRRARSRSPGWSRL